MGTLRMGMDVVKCAGWSCVGMGSSIEGSRVTMAMLGVGMGAVKTAIFKYVAMQCWTKGSNAKLTSITTYLSPTHFSIPPPLNPNHNCIAIGSAN